MKQPTVEEEDWTLPDFISTVEQVDNWEQRIATYDEQRQGNHIPLIMIIELMRLAVSKLEQYEEGVLQEDWTDLVNDRKMGVVIQSRTSPTGGNSIKAFGTLDYPVEVLTLL